ncbi:MAG: hypothetical protein PHO63_00645 [Bacilli bacterium]|nr:hypothetical protein [Bacilli bacterium]MDD4809457.1 hypothetical protein [Bacilli bacterium]
MKKENKIKKYWIIILLFVLATISIGYALFADVLNIHGTARTVGEFDIQISESTIISAVGCTPTTTISSDKKSLLLEVPNLKYPGATTTINVVVKNQGNIAAKLLSVDLTGHDDPDIRVIYSSLVPGIILEAEETHSFDINIAWDLESTIKEQKTLYFEATLNYEQDV